MPVANIRGINLHYRVWGVGEPLLLIMGYRGSGFMWGEEFVTPLSRYFHVITFDNRGTGLSDKPDTVYTIPMMADDAAGLLSALGIERAHVFGVSMGGMIAQELALRHAKRVKRLILGCTTCGGPQAIMAPLEVMAPLFSPPDLSRREALQRQWQVIFSADFLARQHGFLERLTARALAYPTPFHTGIRQAMAMQRFNTYGRLGQIMAPTLVVTGDADIVVPPANSRLLANKVPGAMCELFTGAGHGFFWEASKGVIELLGDFCSPCGQDDASETWTG